jgi:hypothetical protein
MWRAVMAGEQAVQRAGRRNVPLDVDRLCANEAHTLLWLAR